MSMRHAIRAAVASGKGTPEQVAKAAQITLKQACNNLYVLASAGKLKRVGDGYVLADWPEESLKPNGKGRTPGSGRGVELRRRTEHGVELLVTPEGDIRIEKRGAKLELRHDEVATLYRFIIGTCPLWDPKGAFEP